MPHSLSITAAFFKHYRRILAHPEILDNPPEEVLSDID